jgi:hypothetical protein
MKKLPAETRTTLQAALASGKLPGDPDDAGYDDVYSAFGELAEALGEAWADPKATPTQRSVAALLGFWEAIPWDGLVVGIAANQPGVVGVALAAAKSMKLPVVAQYLKEVQSHIPAVVIEMDDCVPRNNWYQTPDGEKHAAALEKLEHEIQEGEFGTELLLGALQRVLAEPKDFVRGT